MSRSRAGTAGVLAAGTAGVRSAGIARVRSVGIAAALLVTLAVAHTVALAAPLAGQALSPVDSLTTIRAPLSPAFALMGSAPVAIERPTTPRAFAAALLVGTQGLTELPEAWAIEVAPYWLRPRPLLTYQDYYRGDAGAATIRSLTLSVASARRDTSGATELGVGLRAQPIPGRESGRSVAIRAELTVVQRRMSNLNAERRLIERRVADPDARAAAVDSIDALIESLADSARARAVELRRHQERVGWSLDLAAATVWAFPTPAFESGRNAAWAGWATLGYRWEDPAFQLLLLGRFIRDTRAEPQNLIDGGLRWLWDVDRLVVSVEGVRRTALDIELDPDDPGAGAFRLRSSGRLVGSLEYMIDENVFLYASFGRDHRHREDRHPLLVIAGISLEFGGLPALVRAP